MSSSLELQLEDILMNPSSRDKSFPNMSIMMTKFIEALGREVLEQYNMPFCELKGYYRFEPSYDAYDLILMWNQYQIVDQKLGQYNNPILILDKKKFGMQERISSEFLADFAMDSAFTLVMEKLKLGLIEHCKKEQLAFYTVGIDPTKLAKIVKGFGNSFPSVIEVPI